MALAARNFFSVDRKNNLLRVNFSGKENHNFFEDLVKIFEKYKLITTTIKIRGGFIFEKAVILNQVGNELFFTSAIKSSDQVIEQLDEIGIARMNCDRTTYEKISGQKTAADESVATFIVKERDVVEIVFDEKN